MSTVPPHIFDPIRNALFSLTYIGAPLSYPYPVPAMILGGAGVAFMVVCTVALAWHRGLAAVLPWLCLAAFVALNAAITSYGRLIGGYDLAMSPYRQAFSLLFWIALSVVAVSTLASRSTPRALIAVPLAIFAAAFVRSAYVAHVAWNVDEQVRQQRCI